MKLTPRQKALHEKAIGCGRDFRKCEWSIVEVLQEVEKSGLHKKTDCSTLFAYAVKYIGLDESVAYVLIQAARLALKIEPLAASLRENRLSLAKAARIFSTLNTENAKDLVAFAESHSAAEINRETSRIRARAGLPPKLKNLKASDDTIAKAKRLRVVLKLSGEDALDRALNQALEEALERHDPVRKANRAMKRKTAAASAQRQQETADGSADSGDNFSVRTEKRKPFTAAERHEVFARDGGQCTDHDAKGIRCKNDQYLHIHHIVPVSEGGTNDPSNLTTLCWYHHDLAHQLCFPLEEQVINVVYN